MMADPNVPNMPALPPANDQTNAGMPDTAPLRGSAAGNAQPSPDASNLPAGTPATPKQVQAAIPNHTSLFHGILNTLAGGGMRPVKDAQGNPGTDPNTGQVQMAQASKKTLGMSILAGALAGMASGFGTSTQSNIAKGNPADIDAFAKKAGTTQALAQQGAQEQADQNKLRMYTNVKQNLDMHLSAITLDKADRENQQGAVDRSAHIIEGVKQAGEAGLVDKEGKPLHDMILPGMFTNSQMMDMTKSGQYNASADQAVPAGVIDVPNPDGKGTHSEMQWRILRDAYKTQIPVTQDLIDDDPRFKDIKVGTLVPISVFTTRMKDNINGDLAETATTNMVGDYYKAQGKPVPAGKTFAAAVKKDPLISALVPLLNKYHTDDIDSLINDLRKDPDFSKDEKVMSALSKFEDFMGINHEGIAKMTDDRLAATKTKEALSKQEAESAAKRATPEGAADLQHKLLENKQLEQASAQAEAQGKGLEIPASYVPNPRAAEMNPQELTKDLMSQGVNMPSNFAALYAIGHNSADLATLPTTPRKGVPQMPRDQALAFIRTYVNPQYNEGDYAAARKLNAEYASTRVGTAGGTLQAAGVASQHLLMLKQAADAMKNNNIQFLNEIGAKYGVATGAKAPVVFAAIAQKVNTEVEKVVSGSAPMEAQLKEGKANLERFESPEQIDGVIRGYVGLMNGRLGELHDRHVQYFGNHVHISPNSRSVLQSYGFSTPDQPQGAVGTFVDKTTGREYWTDGKKALAAVETSNTQH